MSGVIKGFPSNNKVSSQRDLHYSNIEPVFNQKDALAVKSYMYARVVASDAVEAGTTTDDIVATAHVAQAGDIISFTSGALSGQEFVVSSVTVNDIILSEFTSVAASAADTFDILRHKVPVVGATGSPTVQVTDGTDTLQVYQEDAASAGGELGLAVFGVRNDAGVSPVSANGDFHMLQFDANGNLRTAATVVESAVYAEDSASASGDNLKAIAGVRNDASAVLTSADGDYSAIAVDSAGRLKSVVESVIPGVAATSLGKAEDAPHASGDTGVMVLAVRQDAAGPMAADGDYTPLQTNANGELKVAATFTEQAVFAEDSAHVSGNTGKFVLAVRNDAGTSLVSADGDYAPIQVDSTGAVRVAATVSSSYLDVVDELDTPLFDASTINGSAGAFVQVVASTAAQVRKIQALSTSGVFIGLYTGAAAAETLKCIIGPGSDQTLEVSIAAATRITLRSMETTGGSANEFIAINFLG